MNLRPIFPGPAIRRDAGANGARAQDKGSVDLKPLPPLDNPHDPKIGAKQLFARKLLPAAMPTRSIGSYVNGCLAGAASRCRSMAKPGR